MTGISISVEWERKPPGYPSCLRNVLTVGVSRSCAETCQPPLKIRFVYLAKKYVLKSFAFLDHPLPDGLKVPLGPHSGEKYLPH